MKKGIKTGLVYITYVCIILIVLVGIFYKWCIPTIFNSIHTVNFIQRQISKTLDADVRIEGVKLKTGMDIAFNVDKFVINKSEKNILTLADIDILLSIRQIYKKNIVVKKMLAQNIYVDIYSLLELLPQSEKKKEKSKSIFNFDLYNTLLGVKNVTVIYNSPSLISNFSARHAIFDRTNTRKYLHVDFDFYFEKNGHKIDISANDKNRIFMENHVAYVKDFPIEIEKSKIVINAFMTNKGKYELNISGKDFNAKDIADIVSSNAIIANGSQMLEPIIDINGAVNFNVKLTNNNFNGNININEVNFKVKPLLNMPVKITQGIVDIDNKDINFKEFKGYYNNKPTNTLNLKGYTKDYHKTCDTKLSSDIFVTNDFFINYLSKMLSSPVQLVGDSMSKLVIKSKNGSMDILWFFLLKENYGFIFGDQSMVLKDYKTFFKVDLSVIKNILKINTIDYHITQELKRGMIPIVRINGNLDMAQNMKILDLNIDIPQPLSSEFLNYITCQKIFKKGKVSGKMYINNKGDYPFMTGEFSLDKVIIPAQRLFIKTAKLTAKDDKIILKSEGKLRRENYTFDGYLVNKLVFPIIVKNVNLTIDNIDVEKILSQSGNPNEQNEGNISKALVSNGVENEEDSDTMPTFQKGLVIVEKCSLNILKGFYKEILFGDVRADMNLDKEGVLTLKSNRFDIAGGISTLKATADLVKRNYYLRLGVRDVDSNIMASAILGLPRQISGKAKGLIELHSDSSLNLNGDIKFKINNGTIEQVGYVEYILKVASLFRNPLAMFSPATVFDLVNIPEGKFDEINGEMKLKDNIIQHMKIESSASELATFIVGRYNLSTNDATLRVYTKFSDKGKGFAGALRHISLNSLASKLSISARNESNYYANELSMVPKLKIGEENAQVFLTKIDGDLLKFNFLSSLKRIK